MKYRAFRFILFDVFAFITTSIFVFKFDVSKWWLFLSLYFGIDFVRNVLIWDLKSRRDKLDVRREEKLIEALNYHIDVLNGVYLFKKWK